MKLKPNLLRWLLRTARPIVWKTSAVAVAFVLFWPAILKWNDLWPALFIAAHAMALAIAFGRFRNGEFAFLYSRGYSRDALYGHMLLASAIVVLAAWLPAALIVWTGLRSVVQDLMMNPFFPLMRPREMAVPVVWLLGYAAMLPVLHYWWIREAQPTRGARAGALMVIAVLFCGFFVLNMNVRAEWHRLIVVGAALTAIATALVGAWRLHKWLEVRA